MHMYRAAKILSVLGFIFLLLELITFGVLAFLFGIPAVLQSYDESFTSIARILTVIFGVFAGLCLIALPASIIGKNHLYDGEGQGSKALMFAGVISFNVLLFLAGFFAWRDARLQKGR